MNTENTSPYLRARVLREPGRVGRLGLRAYVAWWTRKASFDAPPRVARLRSAAA